MNFEDLKDFLNQKAYEFERIDFIKNDPILIPHRFTKKQDIEIAGFLTAIIAWGQRKTIINNASKLMDLMDHAPHDFIQNYQDPDLIRFKGFVHRTFNQDDLLFFIYRLKQIYSAHLSLEDYFSFHFSNCAREMSQTLSSFKADFFSADFLPRTRKHLPDPLKGSAAKRFNMFLRWMVRSNRMGVDFGLWSEIKPSDLYLPLDVHTGRTARQLGLLKRSSNDWKALEEVMHVIRGFDPIDPVKYDFALFGLGVSGMDYSKLFKP